MDNLFFSSISFTPPPHANPSQSTGIIFNTRATGADIMAAVPSVDAGIIFNTHTIGGRHNWAVPLVDAGIIFNTRVYGRQ